MSRFFQFEQMNFYSFIYFLNYWYVDSCSNYLFAFSVTALICLVNLSCDIRIRLTVFLLRMDSSKRNPIVCRGPPVILLHYIR